MKVIHGMSEVAGQGIYSVKGLRNNGVVAEMAVWSRNKIGYETDIDLKIDRSKKWLFAFYSFKMLLFALYATLKYDVVHSHFGYTLLPYNLDIPFLKFLRRKLYAEFHGSDIRFVFKEPAYRYYKNNLQEKNRKKQVKRLSYLIKNVDGIILHDMELFPQVEEFGKPVYIEPLRVDITKFNPCYPEINVKKPVIVHAPSNRKGKGTDKILKNLKKIKTPYELILVEGKTQNEAFELYKKADIIIDQISVGAYGVFAIEAMALGKPVITYISDDIKRTLPESLPIVSAGFDDIADKVENLLLHPELRRQLGMAGRQYVERYHDTNKITRYLAEVYKGTITDNNIFHLL